MIRKGLFHSTKATSEKGALVFEVISDTPAERKGLLKGDIITHVNNSPINKKSIKQISFQIRGKINSKIKPTSSGFLFFANQLCTSYA